MKRLSPLVAGIVVFHPDMPRLAALTARLLAEADRLVVFLNSDVDDDLRRRWAEDPRVTLIEAVENLGIGVGLNLIALEALRGGAGAIAFFDQDSEPPVGLLERLRAAWCALEDSGRSPGVVSPLLVAPSGVTSKAPRYRYRGGAVAGGSLRPVAFVPTSGSLIAADVLRRVGLFRADYFIDGIDIEWSFRARARGYGSWVVPDLAMVHSVGSGTIGSRRLGWQMPKQRPFRMYCVVRNTLYGLRLGHIPLGWKVRQVLYLPLQMGAFALHHRLSPSVFGLLLAGVGDGMAGRLGPPRGLAG